MGIFGGFRIWGRLSARMGVFTCEVRSGMGGTSNPCSLDSLPQILQFRQNIP